MYKQLVDVCLWSLLGLRVNLLFCNFKLTECATTLQEIKKVGLELGISPTIIQGEELREKGFGGTVYSMP